MDAKVLAASLALLSSSLDDAVADLELLLGDGSDADDGAFAKARAREVESSYAKLLAALSGAERDKLERDIGPRIAGMQAIVKQLPQF